jgi:Glycosyltransferase family 87
MKSETTSIPAPLKVFSAITVVLTLLSWLFAFVCARLHLPAIYSWPYNVLQPGSDFSSYQERFRHLHTMQFFRIEGLGYLYPAPLAIFYHALFVIWGDRPHPIRILIAFTIASACIATIFFFLALRRRRISVLPAASFCLITLVFSYPLYYEIQRGNVEVAIWITLMAAIWAFRAGRNSLSAVLIGIAIACKWYPVVLLGLFLFPKKWKPIPIALLTAAMVTLFSDWWLGPSGKIAMAETKHGMQEFLDIYAIHYVVVGYDHSFFAFFKFFIRPFHPNLIVDLGRYLKLAAVGATALYFLRIRKLPVINQISILIILMITLPPVSFDYTLLHLYICFGIFTLYVVDSWRKGTRVPMAGWTMAWFAFAMAPHGYVILYGDRYCGQFRFIGLAALLYIFLKYPFAEPEASDPYPASATTHINSTVTAQTSHPVLERS